MQWTQLPLSWPGVVSVLLAAAAGLIAYNSASTERRGKAAFDASFTTFIIALPVLVALGWGHATILELQMLRCERLHEGWQDDEEFYEGRNPCAGQVYRYYGLSPLFLTPWEAANAELIRDRVSDDLFVG